MSIEADVTTIPSTKSPEPKPGTEAELAKIPQEEEAVLKHVRAHLADQMIALPGSKSYDSDMVELRDQMAESREEDIPALLADMVRFASISAQRNEMASGLVDINSPYFGHLKLEEHDAKGTRQREVLIGRSTHIDSAADVRIVDWRNAPVSQLYYRYGEGEEYEETFGDREVDGRVVLRRTVTIQQGTLKRVSAPQGTFVRKSDGTFRVIPPRNTDLQGGQGRATRPGESSTRGKLGVGPDGNRRIDRHLPEISALLDPRQFELISRTDAGLVVIQGGAGSGKTTIGLHRLAYLNFQAPKKFAGSRMMVVTTSKGLVTYTDAVLPSLGVEDVQVVTFRRWATTQRKVQFPWLKNVPVSEDTPLSATMLKKHPGVLQAYTQRCQEALGDAKARMDPQTPVTIWAELLTDLEALRKALDSSSAPNMPDRDLDEAYKWCVERCPVVASFSPDRAAPKPRKEPKGADDYLAPEMGADGRIEVDDRLELDPEDEALLLRGFQLVRGKLRKKDGSRWELEHLFVDEAQDFSAAELSVLLDMMTTRQSVTLAGDTSQRLVMDNWFRGWKELFEDLGVDGVQVEPLHIAYRSTREVLELAKHVLGPTGDKLPGYAPRTGAPVEMFIAPDVGVAVAQLGEALRALALREPRATVGVLARYADQADTFYRGLMRAEVPSLRRVTNQDFVFRPGIDVTEIREVKGLEYDYVIIVEANASTFPDTVEARHLMHVAATRAAHQLWIIATGKPTKILPDWLVDEAL